MSIILACAFVASSFSAHPFMTVNQIIVDAEQNRVELQAAQTMATKEPMNWIFTNRVDQPSPDTMAIRSDETGMYGTGFYGAAAHAFALSKDNELTWSLAMPGRAEWFRWKCSP